MALLDFVEKDLEKKPILLVDIGASGGCKIYGKKLGIFRLLVLNQTNEHMKGAEI